MFVFFKKYIMIFNKIGGLYKFMINKNNFKVLLMLFVMLACVNQLNTKIHGTTADDVIGYCMLASAVISPLMGLLSLFLNWQNGSQLAKHQRILQEDALELKRIRRDITVGRTVVVEQAQ
jgi:hypothetical protein